MNNGEVNLQNTSVMLGVIGEWEDVIFKKRQLREEEMKRRREQNKRHERLAKGVNAKDAKTGGSLTQTRRETGLDIQSANAARQFAVALGSKKSKNRGKNTSVKGDSDRDKDKGASGEKSTIEEALSMVEKQKKKLSQEGKGEASEAKLKKNATDGGDTGTVDANAKDEKDDESTSKEDYEAKLKELNKKRTHRDDVTDTVKLGDEGWKKRYYTQKFGDELFEEDFTKRLWGNTPEACAGCWHTITKGALLGVGIILFTMLHLRLI